MVQRTIKIKKEKEIFDAKEDKITYCKCQLCGHNAVGRGFNSRFFRCQSYPKIRKDIDEYDIVLFSVCDLCVEKVNENDILVLDMVEYIIDSIFREEN